MSWIEGVRGVLFDIDGTLLHGDVAIPGVAEVVGKPNRAFFDQALEALSLPAAQVLVVGDSVANEGRGGAAAGCRTAIVRTGKFSDGDLGSPGFEPDLLLDSAADLLV